MSELISIDEVKRGPRLTSYTRSEKDANCPRSLYYAREWGGTGIVPVTFGWDLVYGNIMHKWLDHLAKVGSVPFSEVRDNVLGEASKVFEAPAAQDWAALAEGTMRAFVNTVWPHWMKEYEVEAAESWIEYEYSPGYVYRHRRDLLLRSRFDGHLSYREYKTTSSTSADWIASWNKSVQLHTGMLLERYVHGREIRDAVVQGLYKGYKDKKNSTQNTVFARGSVNRQYSMSPSYSYKYERSKGWETFSTFNEWRSLEGWVNGMPGEVLSAQLPRTGPIFPREDIVKKYFKQLLIRQVEIGEGVEKLQKAQTIEEITDTLDMYFPQNFSRCEPAYGGFDCEYLAVCWTPWIEADPLGSGQFARYDADWEKKVEVQ